MRFHVLTIFPDIFDSYIKESLFKRAAEKKLVAVKAYDLRAFTDDRHQKVDDRPFGGGPGMVMRADVLARAIEATPPSGDARPRLLMSARGAPLTQRRGEALAGGPGSLIVCGRFAGVAVKPRRAYGLRSRIALEKAAP